VRRRREKILAQICGRGKTGGTETASGEAAKERQRRAASDRPVSTRNPFGVKRKRENSGVGAKKGEEAVFGPESRKKISNASLEERKANLPHLVGPRPTKDSFMQRNPVEKG